MIRSDTVSDLATALASAQSKIQPAAKDAENPHFKSRYADLAAVWEACREPLSSNGLSVVQTFEQGDPGQITVHTTLLHKSGEWMTNSLTLPVGQNTAQGYGSAITYGRRYGLAALIGVVADEDDDGNAASSGNGGASASRSNGSHANGQKNGVQPRHGSTSDQAVARGHLDPDKLDPKLGKFIGSFEGWMTSKQLDPRDHNLGMYLINRAAENDLDAAWTSRKQLSEEDWKRVGKVLTKLSADEMGAWIRDHAQARLRAEVHPHAELVPPEPAGLEMAPPPEVGPVPCEVCGAADVTECDCSAADLIAGKKVDAAA
jgi:hypothetical protein